MRRTMLSRSPVLRSTIALVALVLAAGPLAACGGDDDGAAEAPSDCTPIEGGKATVVGKNLRWDPECLKVAAGSTVTFTVDNQDQDVEHDFKVSGVGVKAGTDLEAGPVKQTLEVEFPTPGFFMYVCTLHATMEGDIFVEEVPL